MLWLLLAKRDQCTSTADASEYAGSVKERGYLSLGASFSSSSHSLLLLFEQCPLDWHGQRQSSVLSFITTVNLKHALQSGTSFINALLKLCLRRIFSVFESRLLLVRHQECHLGAQ